MTTRIGIISDIHANPAPLKEAFILFEENDVDMILCPGDIAGYGEQLVDVITLLKKHPCKCILGNHEVWYLEKTPDKFSAAYQYIDALPYTLELSIENKKVFMVHAQPPDAFMGGIRILDQQGELDKDQLEKWKIELDKYDYDVLIVGHTHQVFAEQVGRTLLINPGSTTFNHCCAILTLPDLTTQFFALSGKEIKKSWNWGEQFMK